MRMTLYNTTSNSNVVNKSLTELGSFNIRLKKDVDKFTPSILLTNRPELANGCNYAFIEGFDRYYFITGIEVKNLNLVELRLRCDVLTTFKDTFVGMKTAAFVSPSSGLIGVVSATETGDVTVNTVKSNVALKSGYTNILTTIGEV